MMLFVNRGIQVQYSIPRKQEILTASLTQSDLPEVGNQNVLSMLLSGMRQLNVRQVQALAARFPVSPAVFMEKLEMLH